MAGNAVTAQDRDAEDPHPTQSGKLFTIRPLGRRELRGRPPPAYGTNVIQTLIRFAPVALSVGLLTACGGAGQAPVNDDAATAPETPAAVAPAAPDPVATLPQVTEPEGGSRVESMESVAGGVPLRIADGRIMQGTLRVSRDGSVPVAGVQIGNYRNQSDGTLFLKLCRGEECRESEASVVGSKDNDYLLFNVQPAISVSTGDEFRFEIRRSPDTRMPLALRTYDATADATAVLDAVGDAQPRAVRIALYYQSP